jgi:hypothetical protein
MFNHFVFFSIFLFLPNTNIKKDYFLDKMGIFLT